jgi:hypothetical protein
MQTDVRRRSATALVCFAATVGAVLFAGCGTKNDSGSGFEQPITSGPGPTGADGSAGDATAPFDIDDGGGFVGLTLTDAQPDRGAPPANCKLPGLWCYQTTAPCITELSGTVFDPAGQVPLSNVVVYVPADPTVKLTSIKTGTNSCSACTTQISNYMALAVTDVNGKFTMKGVPATTDVPVVVQIGKWRREVTLGSVTKCIDNTVKDGTLRLPQSKAEGDIPQMAVVTGGADDLGCFLRGMGLAASEYSAPNAGGRLDVYQGVGGPSLASATAGVCNSANTVCPLYASKPALEYYDIVLLACEGGEHGETKPSASLQFMHDWLNEGGKVFASHFQYYWFKDGPTDFQNVATWTGVSAGSGVGTYKVDTSFNRGMVFDEWLTGSGVGAATGTQIMLNGVADSVSAITADATQWIFDGYPNFLGTTTNHPKYISFLTPIGGMKTTATPPADGGTEEGGSAEGGSGSEAPTYCGKAVFSDLHTSGSPSGTSVPTSCPTTLTAQQKALEYLFFDLAACVAPENAPPPTPPANPPPPPPPPM